MKLHELFDILPSDTEITIENAHYTDLEGNVRETVSGTVYGVRSWYVSLNKREVQQFYPKSRTVLLV